MISDKIRLDKSSSAGRRQNEISLWLKNWLI